MIWSYLNTIFSISFLGLQVEAVMDRIKDKISLDHLSRLLVEVQSDSSTIVDSIISKNQRDLLQFVFLGDAINRNKINLIIANEITPHLTAEEYMDKGEYENELKQVIGDTKAAYDISEYDTLVFGSYGLLVAGPNSRHHEPLLCAYLQFITIDIFLQNLFSRLWILNDDLTTTNKIILDGEKDPRSLERIRYRTCKLAKDIIQFEEILAYITDALEIIEIPPEPVEQAGRSLYERLEIGGMRNQLIRRANDMKKNIFGSNRLLDVLREMSSVVSESKTFHLNESVDSNTQKMCLLQDSNERTAGTLQMLQFISGGILSFQILDRVTGQWSVANSPWFSSFYQTVIQNAPLLWFMMSFLAWFIISMVLSHVVKRNHYKKQGITTIKIKIGRRIHIDKLKVFLTSKLQTNEERTSEDNNDVIRITYVDIIKRDWGGSKPVITMEYDEKNCYLLSCSIEYRKRLASKRLVLSSTDLQQKILSELTSSDVWDLKGEDKSNEDLASDKRAAIEKLVNDDNDDDD